MQLRSLKEIKAERDTCVRMVRYANAVDEQMAMKIAILNWVLQDDTVDEHNGDV